MQLFRPLLGLSPYVLVMFILFVPTPNKFTEKQHCSNRSKDSSTIEPFNVSLSLMGFTASFNLL